MTIIPLVLFTAIAFSLQNKTWSPATVRISKAILYVLMGATIVVLASNAIRYLSTPGYFEYGEENIASVAAYWLRGHPIYHSLANADRYSLLYGPLPTLINALFQKTGWDVFFASKLPGVLSLILTLILMGALVRRNREWPLLKKMVILATFAAILIDFYNASFWDRPDAFILPLTVLSLLLAETPSSQTSSSGALSFLLAAVFGIIGGCLANCKINACVDVIPSFVFYLERKNPRNKIGLIAVFCLMAAATGFAFFLIPGVSLKNFLAILFLATHELNFKLFRDNIIFLLPFAAIFILSGFQARYRGTFYALAGTLSATVILACKTGSGLYYFMPFLPLLFYFAAVGEETLVKKRTSQLRRFAVCCFLGMFWMVPQYEGRYLAFFNGRGKRAVADLRDLRKIEKKYPGPKSMGVTDKGVDYRNYDLFYLTPELVSRGGRMLVDMPSIMDFHLAHVKIPEATYQALGSCEVREFVLPATGKPWTAGSIYHHQTALFTRKFRKLFAEHYKKIDTIGPFALYKCSKSGPD